MKMAEVALLALEQHKASADVLNCAGTKSSLEPRGQQ